MRNSQQLQAAIEKQEQIVKTATSEMTRNYARERISYLRGELMLQREYERQQAEDSRAAQDIADAIKVVNARFGTNFIQIK